MIAKRLSLTLALLLIATGVGAQTATISWDRALFDVNNNVMAADQYPENDLLGVRVYNGSQLIADLGVVDSTTVELPWDTDYSITVEWYNSVGRALRSTETRGRTDREPPPPPGVPEQVDAPTVELSAVGGSPPDLTYRTTRPSGDSIHPAAPPGSLAEVNILSGTGVEVLPNGSTRARSDRWSVSVRYNPGGGWTQPEVIAWAP